MTARTYVHDEYDAYTQIWMTDDVPDHGDGFVVLKEKWAEADGRVTRYILEWEPA